MRPLPQDSGVDLNLEYIEAFDEDFARRQEYNYSPPESKKIEKCGSFLPGMFKDRKAENARCDPGRIGIAF